MAIEVKPRSSDYPTKPTPPVSTPPHRDYQHNNNQVIPTTTTKDQAIAIPPGISKSDTSDQDFNWMFAPIEDTPGFTTSDQDDFHTIPTITTQDQAFNSVIFDIFPTSETTIATTTGTATTAEVTLEEFQQWEDEHYEAEDRAFEVINPTSKWILLAAALHADIYAPIEEPINGLHLM